MGLEGGISFLNIGPVLVIVITPELFNLDPWNRVVLEIPNEILSAHVASTI